MTIHRKIMFGAAALTAALLTAAPAFAADVTGKWSGDVALPTGQKLPFVAHLTQAGGKLTGKLDGIGGAPDVEIIDGQIVNDDITFYGVRQINNAPVRFAYKGKVVGDAIDFDIVRTDGQGAPLKTHTTRAN